MVKAGHPTMRPVNGRLAKATASVFMAAALAIATALPSRQGHATSAEAVDRTALRVCADPSNLPFSNKAEEGFENRIAELMAEELGVPLRYTWYPQTVGFIRSTLRARLCDLVIGVATGNEMLQNTNPYYRSTYALIMRDGEGPEITSINDPALKRMNIGVVARTPPASVLARAGLMAQVRPYRLVVDTRYDKPGKQMAEDVASGEIDVGLLWGPIAGYYAKRHNAPLKVVPITDEGIRPKMDFRISMGVRFNEPDWKRQLNDIIRKKQPDITAILLEYGVPLLDGQGRPITQ